MESIIRVLIVEDDFRVANINREYVLKMEGFDVMYVAKTAEEALNYLQNTTVLPHVILLDIYLPDDEDLTLFWTLRRKYSMIDLVMLTAANEVETIQEIFHGGVFDYLIKPADFTRFEQTFIRYKEQLDLFTAKRELEQSTIDRLTGIGVHFETDQEKGLPKGIDKITLDKIEAVLKESSDEGATAISIGNQIGVSRSTARRYLEYLVSIKEATAHLKYGEIGRPERRYTL